MASLPETPTYDAGVYQKETTDEALGGAAGKANAGSLNLANRTGYLKAHVDLMEAIVPQAEAEAGTATTLRGWNALRVKQAINARIGSVALLKDQKTTATAGGTFDADGWRTRDLNTEIDPNGIVTLAANQFVLEAGTYHLRSSAPACNANIHQSRLQNITDSATTAFGSSENISAAIETDRKSTCSFIDTLFTIAAAKTFELQHYCSETSETIGFGFPTTFGTEVYTQISISKIG